MSASGTQWIWSAPHNKYYYVTYDAFGQLVYNWSDDYPTQQGLQTIQQQPQQGLQAIQPQPQQGYSVQQTGGQTPRYTNQPQSVYRTRADSASGHDDAIEPVPDRVRVYLQGLITGTPGRAEDLDQSYYVRTGTDARRFFVLGRVFAMLYSENAGYTSSTNGNDDAYSAIRYNEYVYSTIRRFVVVNVRQGFVYACGISTYSNRATLKPGCVPSEHAVVYFSGTDPSTCYVPGERERGLHKEPIEVEPVDNSLFMKRESRIRFSKTIPVEMNVKVKDIGRVHYGHMSKLVAYWEEEFGRTAS